MFKYQIFLKEEIISYSSQELEAPDTITAIRLAREQAKKLSTKDKQVTFFQIKELVEEN